MLPSLRYAPPPPPQAQRAHSQREGATINGSRKLESVFKYAIEHTQGDTSQLISDINAALSELKANELPEYAQFQVMILQNRRTKVFSASLQNPSVNQLKLLEVQLKPGNDSAYEGTLLQYLRDALYSVLNVYRRYCPKPIEDTAVRAVSA
jgi:hypothetical protein